jgi:hypothetical protein
MERQSKQDHNAAAASPRAAAGRAVTKASSNYRNESWDLVDALRTKEVKLEDVKEKDLPEKLREMNPEERKSYIEGKAKQRKEIQQRIQELEKQRKAYVAEAMKKRQGQGNTLGSAAIKAVREQAKKRNFTFESSQEPSKTPSDGTSK